MHIVVAIHDRPVWTIPDEQLRRLADSLPGDRVVAVRDESSRAAIAAADVLFAHRLSGAELAEARHLRWVHSPAVGVGTLLSSEARDGRILITNSRGIHSEAIAEHAIALALALRRRLHTAVRRQLAHQWAQEEIATHSATPLSRTCLLVIGLGSIGARIAAHGAALGMHVIGLRKHGDRPAPAGVERVIARDELTSALSGADVITLAAPATPETQGMIGAEQLRVMKRSAVLVNVGRGELIDEDALTQALSSGQLAGAGLDAFRREPLPEDHVLWDLTNVLISPHTAAWSGDYWPPVVDLFLENVSRFRNGQPLLNPVDKAAGY
jgi:phosphoglycerate dehydrogenase-like enzyme